MAESPVSPCVAAEGRIVAYPGAEVVVGTEVAGLIVRLTVKEKSAVRAGDLIAELNSADLRASRAEADARVAEAEADIRFYDREVRRDQALLAKRCDHPAEPGRQPPRPGVGPCPARRRHRRPRPARRPDRQDPDHRADRRRGHGAARPARRDRRAGDGGRHDRRPEPAPDRGRGRRVRRRTGGARVAGHDHGGGVRPERSGAARSRRSPMRWWAVAPGRRTPAGRSTPASCRSRSPWRSRLRSSSASASTSRSHLRISAPADETDDSPQRTQRAHREIEKGPPSRPILLLRAPVLSVSSVCSLMRIPVGWLVSAPGG